MIIFLYGPPGSGKSTIGRQLAQLLDLAFFDLDIEIERDARKSIPEIFAEEGEPAFRRLESLQLHRFLDQDQLVLALGGGALLAEENRMAAMAAGPVICLSASLQELLQRLPEDAQDRPLLAGDAQARLAALLKARAEHYASFPLQLNTTGLALQEVVWKAQMLAGYFRVHGMGEGYNVLVRPGGLVQVGRLLQKGGLSGPAALVTDDHLAPLYAGRIQQSLQQAGYACSLFTIPSGEAHKNLETLSTLWDRFLSSGLDRRSTVLALGGGVVTDLTGFAAATFLRGIRWTALPTSILGMVDASLGGKTGIDLRQGKNLVGSFYPPSLVLADPQALATLPDIEWQNGLAEAVKHGVIADAGLFEDCSRGWPKVKEDRAGWETLVRRSMAVKIRILEEDPYEKGRRVVLNLGHTLGHAIEQASAYCLRHGEAVAIGLSLEARIGEVLGITESGTSQQIENTLSSLGLPVRLPPGLDLESIRAAIRVDKKRLTGKIRLPLPVRIGEAVERYEIEEETLWSLFLSCTDRI